MANCRLAHSRNDEPSVVIRVSQIAAPGFKSGVSGIGRRDAASAILWSSRRHRRVIASATYGNGAPGPLLSRGFGSRLASGTCRAFVRARRSRAMGSDSMIAPAM